MKSLFLIIFYLTSFGVCAQMDSQILFKKGYDNFYGTYTQDSSDFILKKNVDSSLFYLDKLNKEFSNYMPGAVNEIISLCYFEKKDFNKSLLYAQKVLSSFKSDSIESDDYCIECNSAAYRIGYIYQTQNQFEKALYYYDSCTTKYTSPSLFCSISYYRTNISQDYNLFTCYRGLGQSEKALAKLTPYLFDSTLNHYLDTSIINDYVQLISTLYSASEIKSNIQMAIDSMHYNVEITKTQNNPAFNSKANCWIILFNTKAYLINGISFSNANIDIENWLSKESQIEKVKNSMGYKKLFVP